MLPTNEAHKIPKLLLSVVTPLFFGRPPQSHVAWRVRHLEWADISDFVPHARRETRGVGVAIGSPRCRVSSFDYSFVSELIFKTV
jgi:hypothetical protein